jgi:hypothetical protein
MSAKSKTHDAAQKKLWGQELKTLEASLRKVGKDFQAEQKQRVAAVAKAEKTLAAEQLKYTRFIARREKVLPKSIKSIETRIAIVRGRLDA